MFQLTAKRRLLPRVGRVRGTSFCWSSGFLSPSSSSSMARATAERGAVRPPAGSGAEAAAQGTRSVGEIGLRGAGWLPSQDSRRDD
jgi:hypothetical protein